MGVRQIVLKVNGHIREASADADTSLLDVLRSQLRLTGAKNGCGEGHCGACTVLLDGHPVRSCTFRAVRAAGHSVETIEGLASTGELHPLQQAFVLLGATQCGFCTPGMVMAGKALLDRNPAPTAAEVKRALRHNLCRCTGYTPIIDAIRLAAQVMRGECEFPPGPQRGGVGRELPSPDAREKVTGAAVFADDLSFEGMLYAAVLRADLPHARVLRVDVSKARALPGVRAVLTARDLPAHRTHGLVRDDWPILVSDRVCYAGDAVAVVAADTPEIAQRALGLIAVELEPLPIVSDAIGALADSAPAVHLEGNLCSYSEIRRGDTDAAFTAAAATVEQEYRTASCEHAFLEPETSVAVPDTDGSMMVYVGSQIPFADRLQVAAALGLPEAHVRIIHTKVGGAFGGKEDIAGQIHAALLAKATGRPVKLRFSRRQSILVHPKRHAMTMRVTSAVDPTGRLTGLRARIYGDTGAYASLGPHVLARAASHISGPYSIPNVDVASFAVYTNNPPAGAFRGFGAPQVLFAAETQMDLLAERLGISPVAIRRRNLLRIGSMSAVGQVLNDSVGLEETLDAALEAGGPEARRVLVECGQQERSVGVWQHGWGIACGFKNVGLGHGVLDSAGAEVELDRKGVLTVRAGAAEVGQGIAGVVSQVAQEVLGVSPGRVRVVLGDTALTPDGGATTASRQTFVTGNAARLAALELRGILAEVAARHLGVAESEVRFRDDAAHSDRAATDSLSLARLAKIAIADGRRLVVRRVYTPPPTVTFGQQGDLHFAYGYATQVAEVDVNVDTGEVRVLKVVAAHDVGRAINPLAVRGQIVGGVVMGVGVALFEELVVEHGRIVSDSLGTYRIPRANHVPEVIPIIIEAPASQGPYGAKGVGEISSMLTPVAITNAIHNACGATLLRLPATPKRVLSAIASQGH